MQVKDEPVLEFIGGAKRYISIPVYQRNYDWKEKQCQRLFMDVEKIANKGIANHFIGTIVCSKSIDICDGGYSNIVLIDGQQRITSIALLLKALASKMDNNNRRAELEENYLINKFAPNEYMRLKLKPVADDNIYYQNIINGIKDDNNSNICNNYKLFLKLINECTIDAQNLYDALNHVNVVSIELGPDDDSQLIFESLNSTGLSLSKADLIRNYLLMNCRPSMQKHLYDIYWRYIERKLDDTQYISDFIKDYLTIKTGNIPKIEDVYEDFKEYAIIYKDETNKEKLLKELCKYVDFYSRFISPCFNSNNDIDDDLWQIKQLKLSTVYPVLLTVFEDCYVLNKISVNILHEVLKAFISYMTRRLICDLPSNSLNKTFAKIGRDIQDMSEDNYLDKVMDLLANLTGKSVFPRICDFHDNFVSKDFYNTNINKYVLVELEKYACNKSKSDKEATNLLSNNISIEHIMPRKLNEEWKIELGANASEIHEEFINTIGNLTLTGYNTELSNKSFADKKNIYKKTNITITGSLNDYKYWNKDTMTQRAEDLFLMAKEIWSLPQKYEMNEIGIDSNAINYDVEYNIMDDIDIKGEKPKQIQIKDKLVMIKTWKEMFIKTCEFLSDYDPNKFNKFTTDEDFCGRTGRIISSTPEALRKPYRLADNLYIEINLSAMAILSYCKLLYVHFDMQNDVSYMLNNK